MLTSTRRRNDFFRRKTTMRENKGKELERSEKI